MSYRGSRREKGRFSPSGEQRHRRKEINRRQENMSDDLSTQSHNRKRRDRLQNNSSSSFRTTSSDRVPDLRDLLHNSRRNSPKTDGKRSNRRFVDRRRKEDTPVYDRLENRKEFRRSVDVVPQSTGFEERSICFCDDLDDLIDENGDACSIDSNKEKASWRSRVGFGRSDSVLQDTAPRYFELKNDDQLQHFNTNEQEMNSRNRGTEQPPLYEQLRPMTVTSVGVQFCRFPDESKKPPFVCYNDDVIPHSPLSDSSMSLTQPNAYESDLVGDLVRYLSNQGNSVRLDLMESSPKGLFKDIKDLCCSNKVEDFVKDYSNVFMMTETRSDFEDVKLNVFVSHCVTLRMCERHCLRAGSCTRSCGMLHICKFYVMSSCEDYRCKFGHDFYNRHNLNVLKGTYAHRMNPNEITEVLLSQRDAVSLPQLCTYYNAKGCTKRTCPFLHICKHFVTATCKFKPCKRSHNLTDNQPSTILRKFCLGHFLERKEKERILLDKLAMVLEDNNKEPAFNGTLGRTTDECERSTFILFNGDSDRGCEWQLRPNDQNSFRPVDHIDEAEIERKYQLYLQSREQKIRIGGEEIRINFEKMEGIYLDTRKSPIYFRRIKRPERESPTLKKRKRTHSD